jgi:hypothetical protein
MQRLYEVGVQSGNRNMATTNSMTSVIASESCVMCPLNLGDAPSRCSQVYNLALK